MRLSGRRFLIGVLLAAPSFYGAGRVSSWDMAGKQDAISQAETPIQSPEIRANLSASASLRLMLTSSPPVAKAATWPPTA